jgi:glycogen synthase
MAHLADGDRECALYEGRSAMSQCALQVLGVDPVDRGHSAAFLANAAAAMVRDAICKPDAIIAWGESAAAVLPAVQANVRVFALPTGTWGPPLSPSERAALNCDAPDLAIAKGSLAGLGAVDADVVVFPSPSSALRFQSAREFSFRASDQGVVSVRFGCDEAPHDPATDPDLAATFSAEAPAGKAECRKALARRTSLALGRRTLLVATAPLVVADGGRRLIDTIGRLIRSDVAVVVPGGGERALVDEVKRIAIETPGKIAVYPDTTSAAERQILAGADALLLADKDNHLARTAGLAMRYGTLPMMPDCAAYHDYVVDYDVASRTGHGLLYLPDDSYESVSVLSRCANLRGNPDLWRPLQETLMRAAPRWATTAAQFEELCLSPSTPS